MEVKKSKKISIKKTFMVLFCFISMAFILFVGIFMGLKVFRSKGEYSDTNLSKLVKDKYQGDVEDNYVLFSNMLFRIVKINENNAVELILNNNINIMKNENDDVMKYINDVFIKQLDISLLTRSIICEDMYDDNAYTCKKKNIDNYVKLLEMYEYYDSFSDDKTFLTGNFWLGTLKDNHNTLVVTSDGINYDLNTNSYGVRPVITLKNTAKVLTGDGTLDNPFVVKTDETLVGSYIKLDKDVWVVYEENDNYLKLMLDNLYQDGMFNYRYSLDGIKYNKGEKQSIAYYLNNEYYESLSYKDKLVSFSVCTGEYINSYKDICSKKMDVLVGIPTIVDLKFGEVDNYYLANGNDNAVYALSNGLILSSPLRSLNVRPTIMIKKMNFISGNGTSTDPFVGEV